MIKKLLKNMSRIAYIIIILMALVAIRTFESCLFYDPFLTFYKSNYQNQILPAFNGLQLFFGILFRYGLNTFLSLSLIYLLFRDKKILIFSAWLYVVFFILLSGVYFGILILNKDPNYLVLFYVRRFLIQPLFLLLFVPAFYYQKKINK